MNIEEREHYDLMEQFEKEYKHLRLDRKKDRTWRARGYVYENIEANELFKAFRLGYSLGKAVSIS